MNFLINICIINGYILHTESSQLHPVNRERKRQAQLDFRVNLVMQLVDGYSSTSKTVKPLMTIYPMANGDPLLHAYTRLNRKRSICKFFPKYGEKRRKETLSGCVKCNKHLCTVDCHRQFHVNIGVNLQNITEE